jgi:hypothetical protein
MANIFPNYLQRAAAEIAKASQTKRLELAYNYAQTINDLPVYRNAADASLAIRKGTIVNGNVYYNDELRTLAVAKEQKLK